jgi:hypothetical protein
MNEENSDGGLRALVMQCAFAVLAGQRTITVSTTGKRLAGFPRGELLSVGTNGASNYAVCPVNALAWCHSRIQATLNPRLESDPT